MEIDQYPNESNTEIIMKSATGNHLVATTIQSHYSSKDE